MCICKKMETIHHPTGNICNTNVVISCEFIFIILLSGQQLDVVVVTLSTFY